MKKRIMLGVISFFAMVVFPIRAYAGGINEYEQKFINVLSKTHEYNGAYYVVADGYIDKVINKLSADDIDWTYSDYTTYLSTFKSSFDYGISEGYLVKVGDVEEKKDKPDKKEDTKTEVTDVTEETEESEVADTPVVADDKKDDKVADTQVADKKEDAEATEETEAEADTDSNIEDLQDEINNIDESIEQLKAEAEKLSEAQEQDMIDDIMLTDEEIAQKRQLSKVGINFNEIIIILVGVLLVVAVAVVVIHKSKNQGRKRR